MSLGKVARKLKRVGKSAVQFRFISTFEDVELSLSGSWRPDTLRVVWMRNHRKVKSTDVKWVPTEDRGPNGADGKAVFDPAISVALIVTLYRETGQMEFQEKEYKYYIENYGPNGKKTLASFHCDMSEYAGVPSAEHALAMTFKPVSVKVTKAVLGITLRSEFIKQGSATDDDMLSTFSAMSTGTDASYRDDEDEDDIDDGPALRKLSVLMEDDEGRGAKLTESLQSVLVLGTGETLKRNTLPSFAPPKPSRGTSVTFNCEPSLEEQQEQSATPPSATPPSITVSEAPPITTASNNKQENGQTSGPSAAQEEADKKTENDQLNSSRDVVTKEGNASCQNGISGKEEETEHIDKNGTSKVIDEDEGLLSPRDEAKETSKELVNGHSDAKTPLTEAKQNGLPPETQPPSTNGTEAPRTNGTEPPRTNGTEPPRTNGTEPPRTNGTAPPRTNGTEPPRTNGTEPPRTNGTEPPRTNGTEPPHTNEIKPPCTNGTGGSTQKNQCKSETNKGAHDEQSQENGESLVESVEPKQKPEFNETSAGGGGYDYVFEAARSLAQLRKTSEASRTSDRVSVRKQVQSQDEYRPPPNPYLADEEEEIEESMEPPSPSAAWLVEEAMFVDCFGEAVGREKLDRADLIALYFSASWCPPCRRFLPKLVKFYHHLKQNGKSFELLYISSDYSKQETMKYMQQQQMPWVGLAFEGKVALNLQKMFSVAAIPQLKIVSTKGEMVSLIPVVHHTLFLQEVIYDSVNVKKCSAVNQVQ